MEDYKVKGVMGCANRHVEEETLIKAYLMAWNALVENREDFMEQWTEQLQSENLLEGYRAEKFIEYTDGAEPLTEMDTDFMLKTLDHIKVFEDGTLLEALQKADVYYDEYEPYQKNIDHLLVDMENDQYRFIYYQSIQKRKKCEYICNFLRYRKLTAKNSMLFYVLM